MLKIPVLVVAAACVAALPVVGTAQESSEAETAAVPREKVLGIGGFFFRADDPAALSEWYREHLGIDPVPRSYDVNPWMQEAGPTVFAPFPRAAKGMAPEGKEWVMNLRVRDLDAMAAQLESAGIEVKIDPQTYPNGRFAGLEDPEGNPIQLWQEMDPADFDEGAEAAP